MRIPALIAVTCLFGATTFVQAQAPRAPAPVQGPAAPEAPPTFELDKGGKRAHIDFTLKVKPISDPNAQFSKLAGHKSLVFYFSAQCPHCQHAFPYVQKIADSLATKGFSSVAIAVKFNSEDDIHNFIRDFNARVPILQDDDRSFGENYGTGYVPVIYLVNEKGEYIRYKHFPIEPYSEDQSVAMIMKTARSLTKK